MIVQELSLAIATTILGSEEQSLYLVAFHHLWYDRRSITNVSSQINVTNFIDVGNGR